MQLSLQIRGIATSVRGVSNMMHVASLTSEAWCIIFAVRGKSVIWSRQA